MEVRYSATGRWRLNNSEKQYNGDLYLDKDDGSVVLYIRIPNSESKMSFFHFPLNIPVINGSTVDGAKITLIDCVRIETSSRIGIEDVFEYQATYMLNGVNFEKEDDIKFTKMKVSIPGIIKWGAISNYINPDIDKTDVLIGLDNTKPIKIFSCEEYTLSYLLHCNYAFFDLMKEEITLKQTPYIEVEAQSPHSLDWFLNIVIKIKQLIEIAMGKPLGFDSMVVESPEIYYESNDNIKFVRPIEVVHAFKNYNSKNNGEDKRGIHNYLFDLNELKNANFSKWQEISSIMEPIIELYIDSLYNEKLSISRHFLNMVQALETYHSRRISNSFTDFKKRVERLTDREDYRKFLLNDRQKYITLRSRLADLLLADFQFYFYTANIKRIDFPKVIADTRNYYTHYDMKNEDKALKGDKLLEGFYILRNILEYYLLKELGFELEFIHNRVRDRIKFLRTRIEIKETDERNHNKM